MSRVPALPSTESVAYVTVKDVITSRLRILYSLSWDTLSNSMLSREIGEALSDHEKTQCQTSCYLLAFPRNLVYQDSRDISIQRTIIISASAHGQTRKTGGEMRQPPVRPRAMNATRSGTYTVDTAGWCPVALQCSVAHEARRFGKLLPANFGAPCTPCSTCFWGLLDVATHNSKYLFADGVSPMTHHVGQNWPTSSC